MNVSTTIKLKTSIESPKTPGGISKSLLTPCRRVGLSRNWKKSGPSPFISPLSSVNNTPNLIEADSETKKRKKCSIEKEFELENTSENLNLSNAPLVTDKKIESSNTPKRRDLQRKKSKTLPLEENKQPDYNEDLLRNESNDEECSQQQIVTKKEKSSSKLSRQFSRIKNVKTPKQNVVQEKMYCENEPDNIFKNIENTEATETKQVSPFNLTKECIVVIQNKMNKYVNKEKITKKEALTETTVDSFSQAFFDSDSDDTPLCQLNKNNVKKECMKLDVTENKESTEVNDGQEDSSQVINEKQITQISNKTKCEEAFIKKLEDKHTSMSDLNTYKKTKLSTKKVKDTRSKIHKPLTCVSDFVDDDEDEFETKRTILIRKSYNKVSKPLKAKSTGSITERDIEEIKARIDEKKKLLLIKALNPETEELRGLIKKWQKGCQDALMELVELMKKQMPEQNVNSSEILQMLKIPPDLVGYDSDNDCFNTPDDASILFSSLNIS